MGAVVPDRVHDVEDGLGGLGGVVGALGLSVGCLGSVRGWRVGGLAAALALKKKKTLLIDLDPQSNATIAFFSADEIQTTMYDIFADRPAEMAKVIRPTKEPNLFVAPARLALARLEQQRAGR